MKKIFYLILLSFSFFTSKAALYSTPGTGVNWTLSDLVANSGGIVTFDGAAYTFTDSVTVSAGDVFRVETDVTVLFNAQVVLKINGTIIVNPPTGALFTASNPAVSYRGLWLNFSSGSSFSKLTYEYAMALRINDCSPSFDQCIIRRNNEFAIPGLSAGTMVLARANCIVTNCQFLDNYRNAVSASALGAAPKFFNCTFSGNIRSSLNTAQISLGSSGSDTIKIVGCTIINPGHIRGGAISVVPQGNLVHVLINNNNISGNRYGINMAGNAEMNAMISYNRFVNNNIENNPMQGGSGIAFTNNTFFGPAAAQKAVVTGNIFENNLWGITIQNRTQPNLGNLNNADTSDDGKNRFINNTNTTVPGIDLYNNSIDPVFAMGNYWNTNIETEVEAKIFHQPDDASLGLVTYSNFILPVELTLFSAIRQNSDVKLQWTTAQEINSHSFVVERSFDGTSFSNVGTVSASGSSNVPVNYSYTNFDANPYGGYVYYRLKLVDLDGSYQYSNIVTVSFPATQTRLVRQYPSLLQPGQQIHLELAADGNKQADIQFIDATGKLIAANKIMLQAGFNNINVAVPANSAKGLMLVKLSAEGFNKTIKVVLQ